jgi:D-glycero-D-manno-heptose 1,7-bisphosphate phosphatase
LRKAIFFDRDGTLLVEFGYLTHPTQVVPYSRSREALRRAKAHGFLVIVVTNQSGIARGYLNERHLEEIHDHMLGLFCGDAGIDAVYYCPHHPEGTVAAYSKPCSCRKPAAGLGRMAAERFGIDLAKSYVVGDKLTDVDFGKALGARACLVRTGFGKREEARAGAGGLRGVNVAADVLDAVEWAIKEGTCR